MIAIRLDVLLQLRRHWRAIDVLLQNEIEYQQAEQDREAQAANGKVQVEKISDKHRQWGT